MSFEHANIVNILKSTLFWTKKTLSGLLTLIKKAMICINPLMEYEQDEGLNHDLPARSFTMRKTAAMPRREPTCQVTMGDDSMPSTKPPGLYQSGGFV